MGMLTKKIRFATNQRGMTLIELMAVVVILGILATVAGAAVVNSFDKTKTNSQASSKQVITEAVQRYVMDNNMTVTSTAQDITATDLVNGGYLREVPKNPAGEDLAKVTVATSASGGLTITYLTTGNTNW